MGLFKRLFAKKKPQVAPQAAHSELSERQKKTAILDDAEAYVLKLWYQQHSLVRQAIFWNASNEMSFSGFTGAASRDATLRELSDSAKHQRPQRIFFFSEFSATAPDGRKVDVIVVEVGDAPLDFYGQRIYSAEDEPKQLAEETTRLSESPFAGMLNSV